MQMGNGHLGRKQVVEQLIIVTLTVVLIQPYLCAVCSRLSLLGGHMPHLSRFELSNFQVEQSCPVGTSCS